MEKLRVIFRLTTYLLLTVLLLPFIILFNALGFEAFKRKFVALYYRLSACSWGVKVRLKGSFAGDKPLLVVSNHCSYSDIPVLGSVAPVHFTPKSDISSWPVIGYLCRLSECIFINRNPRKTAENMLELTRAMKKGWMISLFPEGTTNDGHGVLPFRSSYFSLAEQGLPVQPVTVIYTKRDGSPLSPQAMRKVAWIGEDEFSPHLMDFLAQPGILATVICHDLVRIEQFEDRKGLAAHCHEVVQDCLKKEGAPKGAPL
ncbi:MAG: lysophospholipid acyltransferase family protein [Rickettsiales bacterium]|nr:lysophospholipid acyltransferase family protein [Rickettsiales bacterium]